MKKKIFKVAVAVIATLAGNYIRKKGEELEEKWFKKEN